MTTTSPWGALRISRFIGFGLAMLLACRLAAAAQAPLPEQQRARKILDATGVAGGLVVHVGCGTGTLTAALRANDSYLVHGLDTDPANVEKARARIRALGLYGKVTVEQWTGRGLPYVDNLVNLVVSEDLGDVPMAEVLRVLAPGGVAYVKTGGNWTRTVKPRPKEIDEWTHYLHGPDNNAVAHDDVVGPPRRLQWRAGPVFARHHDVLASVSAMVSAGGRIFYIIDEGPTSLMHYPSRWRLVARDAFNGMLLWKKPIPDWENALRKFRSGPPQLPRRLVAVGDRVYVVLGLTAPVSCLDAATGETVRVYEGTRQADEIICDGNVLLVVTFDYETAEEASAALRRGIPTTGATRAIVAVDARTGRGLWKHSGKQTTGLMPTTLATAGGRVLYQCAAEVVCVQRDTGKAVWRRDVKGAAPRAPAAKPARKGARKAKQPKGSSATAAYTAPTLVVSQADGVVLLARGGQLTAMSLTDGKVLWRGASKPDHHAPADLFVADGLVWSGLFAAEGLDPKTGRVKRTLDLTGLLTPGHHPRCYRNKATNRYVISNKRGMEFFDLRGPAHSRNNWTRGACQYGILPCNGLTYLPPNACCCYPGAMLHGLCALAPRSSEKEPPAEQADRLERGPAYGKEVLDAQSSIRNLESGDWVTLRGDATRSGATGQPLPGSLRRVWEAEIGGKLSAPVVAGEILLVASVHEGRVIAMDARNGKPVWSHAAGGRVDTPPTVYGGLVLFGAADGWVTCVRLSDGQFVWRFRAAPTDRRIVVDGQLESVWPVHGNVLVHDGTAYFAAGRSCYLDGGIYLYGLDPETGRNRCEARVAIPHDQDKSQAFVMAGARPDILVSDGKYVYMQQIKFDANLVRQEGFGRHVMCHSGLADDTWFYRTFWRLGYGDRYDFPNSYIKHNLRVPFGQLLVFDDRMVCGLQMTVSPGIRPDEVTRTAKGCLLFGDPNKPFTPDKKTQPDSDYPPGRLGIRKEPTGHKWTLRVPFQARAMVLGPQKILVAGWPDTIDQNDARAAVEGRRGGNLWVVSHDGKKLAEHNLTAPPVFDGLVAAHGRLYLSTQNGRVLCMGRSE